MLLEGVTIITLTVLVCLIILRLCNYMQPLDTYLVSIKLEKQKKKTKRNPLLFSQGNSLQMPRNSAQFYQICFPSNSSRIIFSTPQTAHFVFELPFLVQPILITAFVAQILRGLCQSVDTVLKTEKNVLRSASRTVRARQIFI